MSAAPAQDDPINARSVLAEDALATLVALLGFERQGGDRAGFKAAQADRLAGLLALAVGAVLDAGERGVDLRDQLALAVTRAQFESPIGL